jgi:hypothetical protein
MVQTMNEVHTPVILSVIQDRQNKIHFYESSVSVNVISGSLSYIADVTNISANQAASRNISVSIPDKVI